MSDSLESLRRRRESAAELGTVVRTMKAMAAANIGQYEMAVAALGDYYRTISLGIYACLAQQKQHWDSFGQYGENGKEQHVIGIVFGSDQGLVGRFNETLAHYAQQQLGELSGRKELWVIGERILPGLSDFGFAIPKIFTVPNAIDGITSLVSELSATLESAWEARKIGSLYLFYNAPQQGATYKTTSIQLLPLGSSWKEAFSHSAWPTPCVPQVIGGNDAVFPALVREYLFVTLYKACTEALASENASRLAAMQRAEKNIGEILDELGQIYNKLRQTAIDEELFDVIAGFEALKNQTD